MDEIYHARDLRHDPRAEPRPAPLWHRAIAGLLKAVLPVAILAGAAWVARDIYSAAPVAERAASESRARLVEVTPAEAATSGPRIEAWGTVAPDRRLELAPEVSGRVVWVSPNLVPGGEVAPGAPLFRLDRRPFELAVAEAEARVAEIEARIRIERGQQQRAERDLSRSQLEGQLTGEERALVLREPQMQELEARRAAAEAQAAAARDDLARTEVSAPFAALVVEENLAPGSRLSAGQAAATLIGTGSYRVVLAVPASAVDWIPLDREAPPAVRLTQPGVWPGDAWREGVIRRLRPALTETGRMAEIVVEVPDPLARGPGREGRPRLLSGSFLRAEIAGREVPGAVRLDRAHLRDGDTVWVMGEDGRLEIRDVELAWRGAGTALVTGGLAPGERIVTTPLATVAEGMALRVRSDGGGGA